MVWRSLTRLGSRLRRGRRPVLCATPGRAATGWSALPVHWAATWKTKRIMPRLGHTGFTMRFPLWESATGGQNCESPSARWVPMPLITSSYGLTRNHGGPLLYVPAGPALSRRTRPCSNASAPGTRKTASPRWMCIHRPKRALEMMLGAFTGCCFSHRQKRDPSTCLAEGSPCLLVQVSTLGP